jgi:hypothetical protein
MLLEVLNARQHSLLAEIVDANPDCCLFEGSFFPFAFIHQKHFDTFC